jgi:hypothetical protein
MVVNVKGAGTTYFLEAEREVKTSDHSCNCKKGRGSVLARGGEGE